MMLQGSSPISAGLRMWVSQAASVLAAEALSLSGIAQVGRNSLSLT